MVFTLLVPRNLLKPKLHQLTSVESGWDKFADTERNFDET